MKDHFLSPRFPCAGPALPCVTMNGDVAGAVFGLSCFGFFASRFPRLSPLGIILSLVANEPNRVFTAQENEATRSQDRKVKEGQDRDHHQHVEDRDLVMIPDLIEPMHGGVPS